MNIQPVTLDGRWVRLEPLTLEHAEALWAAGSDPDLWRYTTIQLRSLEDMREYVRQALAEQEGGVSLPFATVECSAGLVVGTTRFGSIVPAHKRVEIGWTFIAPTHQRTPLNTEAKYLMFRHAFEVWEFNRVELKTNALNRVSRTAMMRLGAKEEGTLRSHMVNMDGTIRDTVYYSVIREEWPQVKTHLEHLLQRDYSISR
jgi:N-acetyltransferase